MALRSTDDSLYHQRMPHRTTSSTIQVVDYDSSWPRIFLELKDCIWPSVSDIAITIEHVGSTSVPGMAAKPVIDMDIVIASRTQLASLCLRLGRLGYQPRGDLGIEDREAFTAPENQPAHHLYACVEGSLALRNHRAVRDYLRSHRSDAIAYSTLKKELGKRLANERARYVQAKTGFILSILERCGFSGKELDSIERANHT
jgi:GrpB-like predicted nucleotidyltransferase (UPF0157 family)